uniref:Uncharacterized protein n=1 Tax=Oryza sativa subsp. japonica TaxID=39947 RepID=Q6H5C8_ORYSJ|nr:hypothetical protein [Oryza sativa Japonica Group]
MRCRLAPVPPPVAVAVAAVASPILRSPSPLMGLQLQPLVHLSNLTIQYFLASSSSIPSSPPKPPPPSSSLRPPLFSESSRLPSRGRHYVSTGL